ncbi:hypothetical protein HZC32_03420 [Candidatus Woesearchaeota archaeon]|nr:hypothetical protein [Candidatus Woesearchaeota archaeon]
MPNKNYVSQRNINCCTPDSYGVDSGDIIAIVYPDGRSEVLCGYAVRRDIGGDSFIACSLKERDRFYEKLDDNTSCGYNIQNVRRESEESMSRY